LVYGLFVALVAGLPHSGVSRKRRTMKLKASNIWMVSAKKNHQKQDRSFLLKFGVPNVYKCKKIDGFQLSQQE
jgi:hypothetical protein